MLIGTFAFANSNESVKTFSKTSVETLALENSSDYSLSLNEVVLFESELLTLKDCTLRGPFTITFPDGDKYTWTGTLTIVGQSYAEFLKEMMAE